MPEHDPDEFDPLEASLQNLDSFDDICSADEHRLIETLMGDALEEVTEEMSEAPLAPLELPCLWHGKYRLTRYLGGGMSDVYLAEQINLADRIVVVKILPAATAAKKQQRLHLFREESKTLAKANRQEAASIVFPIDFDVFQDQPYLVMEHVAGDTLTDFVKSKNLTVNDVIRIVSAAAQSLADAHHLNIVHGDIKPTNLIVRPDQSVQLIDFGLSGFFKDEHRNKFAGTRHYAAPEQLSGNKVDSLTDVYCLGIVFQELLEEIPTEPQTPDARKLVRLAKELADQMAAKQREQRPSSAAAVVSLAAGLLTDTNATRVSRRVLLATGMLAAMGVGTGVFYPSLLGLDAWDRRRSTDTKPPADVIQWIASVDGKCERNQQGRVAVVNLNDCWIDNDSLPQLNVLIDLRHLMLANTNVDAHGVAVLEQPLATLVLAGTATDDRIFSVLKKFRVTTLDVSGTKISGDGLQELPNWEWIDSLGVADMPITDDHAMTIASMKRLRLLNLRSTQITASGIRNLARLNLEQIDLGHCLIEDDAITELAKITSLQRIVLSQCRRLTGECIDDLLRMKKLTAIELLGCQFTPAQISRLSALPHLEHLVTDADSRGH